MSGQKPLLGRNSAIASYMALIAISFAILFVGVETTLTAIKVDPRIILSFYSLSVCGVVSLFENGRRFAYPTLLFLLEIGVLVSALCAGIYESYLLTGIMFALGLLRSLIALQLLFPLPNGTRPYKGLQD